MRGCRPTNMSTAKTVLLATLKSMADRRLLNCQLSAVIGQRAWRINHFKHLRHFCSKSEHKLSMLRYLASKIKTNGPITVADYMKEALTNPIAGYYMHKDVFGQQGDFITSPEISQMFGELLGIWCVNEWMQSGSPKQLHVVELGPGRGTLMEDMLRVFSQFQEMKEAVSVHLVEVSPKLSQLQAEKLTGSTSTTDITNGSCYREAQSKFGPTVRWYRQLKDVPPGVSCFIAHEFLDALPIHKFQKKDGTWHEVLVNHTEGEDSLHYVLSRGPTAANVLLQTEDADHREHVELCPEAGVVVQEMAARIASHGGFALLADYGHDGDKEDTFRAFKEHKLHDPLVQPGEADLTADVDFAYLRKIVCGQVSTHGPVSQESFLHNMGIGVRLKVLYEKADETTKKHLITGYDMLTNPDKMGERFKFFCMLQRREDEYKPAGFLPPS